MRNAWAKSICRTTPVILALTVSMAACQGMDRLEPDRIIAVGDADAADGERGTRLDATSGPEFGSGGRLTEDIAARWVRQIEGAGAEERLRLADQFLREYPGATVIAYLHEIVGDAHAELGNPQLAAESWERAIEMSWPEPDLLALPLTEVELPYEVGWAHFEAGDAALGAEWLARATLISNRPQLEQGLRFLYNELGSPDDSFEAWFESRRRGVAVEAPDFELPGYQGGSIRLSDRASRLTLINFWTPT